MSPEQRSISEARENGDNDFDYDLYNGRVPEGHEVHGIRGVPIYEKGAGLNFDTKTGSFRLAPDSPGRGAGEFIPNFSPPFTGKSPDMGAHQSGAKPMQFGVTAEWTP
jgi:hypothetical protein